MKKIDIQRAIERKEKATGHSVFSPSQLPRIVLCPASFHESLLAPIKDAGPAAKRGTMLHEVQASALTAHLSGRNWQVPAWRALKEEDQYAIRDCMDFAIPLLRGAQDVAIETAVSLDPWGMVEVYGTSDLGVERTSQLHIVDWKFGGTPVSAENNFQLIAYAAGFIGYPIPEHIKEIVTYIAQPALDIYDSCVYSVPTFIDLVRDIKNGITLAKQEDAPYVPGDKQCMFCPAKMYCRARMKWAQEEGKKVFAAIAQINARPRQVTASELVGVLQSLKTVEKYASDIRKFFHSELYAGRTIPGYKLVAGRSSRDWKSEQGALKWLRDHGGVPLRKLFKSKPISPAQAEKVNKSLKKDPDFKLLWEKKDGTPQLVTEDDPRPAVEIQTPENVFGDLADTE